jgi:hypothetical protein
MSVLSGSAAIAARAVLGVVTLATVVACSEDDEGVSYETDVRPIFQEQCVVCHYDVPSPTCPEDKGPIRSLDHPFDGSVCGMTKTENRYYPDHGGLQYDIVPGDPDNSHLMLKITDQRLRPENYDPNAPDEVILEGPTERGIFMPPRPPPSTDSQVETIRQWIDEGATDTQFFRDSVVPLFGEKDNFRGAYCERGGYEFGCVLCGRCHNEGSPTYPVLEVPALNVDNADELVAEWLDNLVGAPAQYRPDLQLIVPGDAESSFLFMKMKAPNSSTALGSPMPYRVDPLSDTQVETLRTWIAEGARNN